MGGRAARRRSRRSATLPPCPVLACRTSLPKHRLSKVAKGCAARHRSRRSATLPPCFVSVFARPCPSRPPVESRKSSARRASLVARPCQSRLRVESRKGTRCPSSVAQERDPPALFCVGFRASLPKPPACRKSQAVRMSHVACRLFLHSRAGQLYLTISTLMGRGIHPPTTHPINVMPPGRFSRRRIHYLINISVCGILWDFLWRLCFPRELAMNEIET